MLCLPVENLEHRVPGCLAGIAPRGRKGAAGERRRAEQRSEGHSYICSRCCVCSDKRKLGHVGLVEQKECLC